MFPQAKSIHAHADGAGRDDDDLQTLAVKVHHFLDERMDSAQRHLTGFAREDVGSDLDDCALDSG